jgi:hypothetical protein
MGRPQDETSHRFLHAQSTLQHAIRNQDFAA